MLLKTKVPNRIVQRRIKKLGGRFKIVPWFRFDNKGYAELDETKLTQSDIIKLKQKFEVVENEKENKENKENEKVLNYEDMKYSDLKKLAKDRGLKLGRVSKEEIIKELEG